MVLQIRDVGQVRHAFRPVVQLRTGGVVAVEVHASPAAGELDQLRPVTGLDERLIRLDVMFAAEALRAASEHQATLPLHLSLWADTVGSRRRLTTFAHSSVRLEAATPVTPVHRSPSYPTISRI